MQKGVFMGFNLGRLVPYVLYLFIHTHMCLAAPGVSGTQRDDAVDGVHHGVTLANPFGSGEIERRHLTSYIQSSLKDGQGGPEISTWEQEVFFLFQLYDYDRSGLLDGLEMMKLLSDYNSPHTAGAQTNELVVSMVDLLLQTQDSNQDGLLDPVELLSPPSAHTQDSNNNDAPHQEPVAENPRTDKENMGGNEQSDEAHQEPQDEEGVQPEVRAQEKEPEKQVDGQHEQQIPEVPGAGEHREVLVHLGQPEI